MPDIDPTPDTHPIPPDEFEEIATRLVDSTSGDAPYNPDVWTLDADRRRLVAEVRFLHGAIVKAIDQIRGWCAPGGPGLFSPAEATEVMMLLRRSMGDRLIDILSAASHPADGDLAEGAELLEVTTTAARRTDRCDRADPSRDKLLQGWRAAVDALRAVGARQVAISALDLSLILDAALKQTGDGADA